MIGVVLRSLILRAENTEAERDKVACDKLTDFLTLLAVSIDFLVRIT